MLSKRLNDFVLIGIMLIVVGLIFLGRVFVLGNIDADIEDVENDILNLENEISVNQDLVEEYRYENVPSESQLTAQIPREFSSELLIYQVEAQMHLSGIALEDDRNLTIVYFDDQSFPEESRFRELSQTFFTTRVQVRFLANDEDEITDLIDRMYEANQLFLVQGIRYEKIESDEHSYNLDVNLNFLTFYIDE